MIINLYETGIATTVKLVLYVCSCSMYWLKLNDKFKNIIDLLTY